VDYLYVESNEGGSSGGHVGLAIDDEIFHFQQDAAGLLRLRRDSRARFRLRYALFENRPVHLTRVALGDADAARLRDALVRRHLREEAEDARGVALDADVALLEAALRQARGGVETLPARAAGYFDVAAAIPAAALADLRAGVAARHGPGFLAARAAAVRAALAALPLRATPAGTAALGDAPTLATRHRELREQLAALDLLAAAPPLRADALVAAPGTALMAAERVALATHAAARRDALAALPDSARPDWGYALLLGMARLAAQQASLAEGRLLLLDAWPADAPAPPLPRPGDQAAYFAALRGQADGAVARRRAACLAPPPGEPPCDQRAYTRLETAANRAVDLRRAAAAGAPPRAAPDPLLPERPAARADTLAVGDAAAAAGELAAARAAAAAHRAGLRAARRYALVGRNCVSELFASIDAALAGADGAVAAAPQAALGGPVDGELWDGIPFVSAANVDDTWHVLGHQFWPSFRQQSRAARLARAPGAAAWLAETTTVGAASYRAGADDSTFLFFTDDALATRPLFGAANLVVALADGVLGLATWPADGGRRLRAGARGALYSLPELAFVNIRKGTTAWLRADEISAAAWSRSTSSAP